MRTKEKAYNNLKITICLFLLIVSIIVSLRLGRYDIPVSEILALIRNTLMPASGIEVNAAALGVFFNIRLPRIILAVVVGAALGASGTVFQGIFKNPLPCNRYGGHGAQSIHVCVGQAEKGRL